MSILRAFAIVIAGGVAFSAGGGAVGYAFACLVPSYYRAVVRGGDSPDFDTVQVGVGLGLTEGLVAGLIVGGVVILACGLSGRRASKGKPPSDDEVGREAIRGGCLSYFHVLLIGSALSLPIGLVIGLIVGALRGEFGCKTARFSREKAIIAPVLAGDPATLGISMDMYTGDGTAYLGGEVPTREDLDRLRSRMRTLMGEARLEELMDGVRVRGK